MNPESRHQQVTLGGTTVLQYDHRLACHSSPSQKRARGLLVLVLQYNSKERYQQNIQYSTSYYNVLGQKNVLYCSSGLLDFGTVMCQVT